MMKWQYRLESIHVNTTQPLVKAAEELTAWGEDGWEAVGITQGSGTAAWEAVVLLKRPVTRS